MKMTRAQRAAEFRRLFSMLPTGSSPGDRVRMAASIMCCTPQTVRVYCTRTPSRAPTLLALQALAQAVQRVAVHDV